MPELYKEGRVAWPGVLSRFSKLKRHKRVIRTMIFASVGFLILVQLYLFQSTNAYTVPVEFGQMLGYHGRESTGSYSHKPFSELEYEHLKKYVETSKPIFNQLVGSTPGSFYNQDDNVVGTTEFPKFNRYQHQPYISNGYIGSRIPNLGHGFTYDQWEQPTTDNLNGWPLFNKRYSGAFVAGFYDIQERVNSTNFPELYENGYESIISAIPQWTTLSLEVEFDGKKYVLDPALSNSDQGKITNYTQSLSLRTGVVSTLFTWLDKLRVEYKVIAHRKKIHIGAVHLKVENLEKEDELMSKEDLDKKKIVVTVLDELDFNTSQRCQLVRVGDEQDTPGIFINFQPHQLDYVFGSVYSTLRAPNDTRHFEKSDTKVSQSFSYGILPGKVLDVIKYAGVVTSDIDPKTLTSEDLVIKMAKDQALNALKEKPRRFFKSHDFEWSQILGKSVSISFPDDDLLTLAASASVYHMAANTRENAEGVTAALGVGGLSSDSYGGMVFWDTDLWMQNGLLPFVPTHAKSLLNYRLHTHDQAKKNVPAGDYGGAAYPWTSGRFGNCTSTGPCIDYEYHINVAVSIAAWELFLSGAVDEDYLEKVAFPLISDAAEFLSNYVAKYNETLGQYITTNLTDPDEFANHIDNGAYTNAGIAEVVKWAVDISEHLQKGYPDRYDDILSKGMHLPTSNNSDRITLEYTGMNSSVEIKQADVIMISYPLGNNVIDEDQAFMNMKYYSMKQISTGPAMTFPIFSIVASQLATTGCSSQSYLHKAVQPYLRGPFAQFLEQNNDNFESNGETHPAFPFLTAHGGFLQAVLQGLTGLRFGYETDDLYRIKRVLNLDPVALPCFGEGVEFKGVQYLQQILNLKIDSDKFVIKHMGPVGNNKANPIDILLGLRNPEGGKYTLKSYDTLEFPLFTPEANIYNSVSECGGAVLANITEGAFGDTPMMMNDGDNSTFWQARYALQPAQVLVDLKQQRNLTGGVLNWGDRPPQSWKLYTYTKRANSLSDILEQSLDDSFKVLLKSKATITAPFDLNEFNAVEVVDRFNTSTFSLEMQPARFLMLEFEGVLDDVTPSKLGATVNEILLFD